MGLLLSEMWSVSQRSQLSRIPLWGGSLKKVVVVVVFLNLDIFFWMVIGCIGCIRCTRVGPKVKLSLRWVFFWRHPPSSSAQLSDTEKMTRWGSWSEWCQTKIQNYKNTKIQKKQYKKNTKILNTKKYQNTKIRKDKKNTYLVFD